MYTLDLYRVAPHETRTFIKLGDNHNYGKKFELVCWVSGQDVDGFLSTDYLSLFYKFELQEMEMVGVIDVRQGIQIIKHALIKHKQSNAYKFYHSLICISVKRFLSALLNDYSYYLLYEKAALKIQRIWLNKFYDPSDKVCQRRLLRELNEMNGEMK